MLQNQFNKSRKTYYMSNVKMSYSFNTLDRLATEAGANLEHGDVLICDNVAKTRRKAIKKMVDNRGNIIWAILYLQTDKKSLTYAPPTRGKVVRKPLGLLDYMVPASKSDL